MYYDNCTRKNHDGTDGYTNYFWCPNPNDVDDQNTFSIDEGDTIGECTEFLYPPGKCHALLHYTLMGNNKILLLFFLWKLQVYFSMYQQHSKYP